MKNSKIITLQNHPTALINQTKIVTLENYFPPSVYASVLNVDAKTIIRYCDAGLLECFKVGAVRRIRPEAWEEFLKNHTNGLEGFGVIEKKVSSVGQRS